MTVPSFLRFDAASKHRNISSEYLDNILTEDGRAEGAHKKLEDVLPVAVDFLDGRVIFEGEVYPNLAGSSAALVSGIRGVRFKKKFIIREGVKDKM